MATRMAYDMGLNIDCSKQVISGDMAVREVEIRKITWWACYKLDRFAIMLLLLFELPNLISTLIGFIPLRLADLAQLGLTIR